MKESLESEDMSPVINQMYFSSIQFLKIKNINILCWESLGQFQSLTLMISESRSEFQHFMVSPQARAPGHPLQLFFPKDKSGRLIIIKFPSLE